jgi:hypothetical protein
MTGDRGCLLENRSSYLYCYHVKTLRPKAIAAFEYSHTPLGFCTCALVLDLDLASTSRIPPGSLQLAVVTTRDLKVVTTANRMASRLLAENLEWPPTGASHDEISQILAWPGPQHPD